MQPGPLVPAEQTHAMKVNRPISLSRFRVIVIIEEVVLYRDGAFWLMVQRVEFDNPPALVHSPTMGAFDVIQEVFVSMAESATLAMQVNARLRAFPLDPAKRGFFRPFIQ